MARSKVMLGDGTVLMDISGDSVTESDVASGKTFHKANGEAATGTNTYDADTSDATAVAGEILDGKTSYKNGVKIVGTMPNRGGMNLEIVYADTPVQIPNGCHDGSGSASIDATERAKLIPGNIKSGVVILGVEGNYSGEGATAQAKSVTPYLTAQTVLPDSGYDYLSQVTVGAIAITETQNPSGGTTVTIGTVAPT